MRRTTVFLDDGLLRRAHAAAAREGTSFAQLVREAVAAYLARETGRPAAAVPSFAAGFASHATDTSERVDQLLWKDPHS